MLGQSKGLGHRLGQIGSVTFLLVISSSHRLERAMSL
jgi:hypothetical protein